MWHGAVGCACGKARKFMRRFLYLSGVFATLLFGFLSIEGWAQAALPYSATIYDKKGISISYPDGWSLAQPSLDSWVVLNVPPDQQDTQVPTVRLSIGYLERPDHGDALSQLAEYANESSVSPTFLVIGGWPAFQRVQLVV